MVDVVTYHSQNAKPHEAWIGYVVLSDGNQLQIRISAASEQQVIARAQAFWSAEKARQDRVRASIGTDIATGGENLISERPSGKGQLFLGKVWMLRRQTGERARVEAGEVAGYEARGYIKAGPRSS